MPKSRRRGRRGQNRCLSLEKIVENTQKDYEKRVRLQYDKEEELAEPLYDKGWGRDWPLFGPIVGWDDDQSQPPIIDEMLRFVDPTFGSNYN